MKSNVQIIDFQLWPWNIMFAYSLNELNIWLKLKWKSFWHKGRKSKVQTCVLKFLHRALATVLSYFFAYPLTEPDISPEFY